MTTLNTIIEEEKKEFDEIALYSDGTIHMGGSRIDKLMTWFTSAMQRAYEAGKKELLELESKGEPISSTSAQKGEGVSRLNQDVTDEAMTTDELKELESK